MCKTLESQLGICTSLLLLPLRLSRVWGAPRSVLCVAAQCDELLTAGIPACESSGDRTQPSRQEGHVTQLKLSSDIICQKPAEPGCLRVEPHLNSMAAEVRVLPVFTILASHSRSSPTGRLPQNWTSMLTVTHWRCSTVASTAVVSRSTSAGRTPGCI